jgi:multiple sugar transport system permease protein
MKIKRVLTKGLLYLIMFCVSVIFAFPIYWIFTKAINGPTGLMAYPPELIPKTLSFENFAYAEKTYHIVHNMANSLIVCGFSIFGATASSAIVAYGFARLRFTGKQIWFIVLLSTIMLPWYATVIPQFIGFTAIGWGNTYLPLIIPLYFGVPFFIFLLRQFIMGIPYDLDEAAIIDGCNRLTVFTKIILPLLKPALITVVIYQFLNSWNDFINPLIYLNSAEKYTISLAVYFMRDPFKGMDWPAVMAGSFAATIFPVTVFFLTQRLLLGGIAHSGLKG